MKKSFSWRVFISFGLFIAVLMMLVSGVILYISPPGRVANWTDWRMIGLTKRGWQNQHVIFGFAFLILSLFHLFFINWKAFLSYLKSKTNEGLKSPGELLTIIVLGIPTQKPVPAKTSTQTISNKNPVTHGEQVLKQNVKDKQ